MSRKVEIELFDVLDLAVSAETYGYADDVLMGSLYAFVAPLTDRDIEDFVTFMLAKDGYDADEDGPRLRTALQEWRKEYGK